MADAKRLDQIDAYYHKAVAMAGKKKFGKSLQVLDELDRIVRGQFAERASILRAQVYYQQRSFDDAVAELRIFKEEFPESAFLPNVNRLLPQFEVAARTN